MILGLRKCLRRIIPTVSGRKGDAWSSPSSRSFRFCSVSVLPTLRAVSSIRSAQPKGFFVTLRFPDLLGASGQRRDAPAAHITKIRNAILPTGRSGYRLFCVAFLRRGPEGRSNRQLGPQLLLVFASASDPVEGGGEGGNLPGPTLHDGSLNCRSSGIPL